MRPPLEYMGLAWGGFGGLGAWGGFGALGGLGGFGGLGTLGGFGGFGGLRDRNSSAMASRVADLPMRWVRCWTLRPGLLLQVLLSQNPELAGETW